MTFYKGGFRAKKEEVYFTLHLKALKGMIFNMIQSRSKMLSLRAFASGVV